MASATPIEEPRARRLLGVCLAWLSDHERHISVVLLAAAVLLRVLLFVYSPTAEGYVWDFYSVGVRVLADTGRLPQPEACWQCSHPPLFYAIGWPLFVLGRAVAPGSDEWAIRSLGLISLAASSATVYYGYRLLGLLEAPAWGRVVGLALLLVFPCLFIGTNGPDGDILLTGLLSAAIFFLARYARAPDEASLVDVLRLGALCGLAAATKYSGLVGLASAGGLLLLHLLAGVSRRKTVRDGLIILAVTILVGGWKYADNYARYHTLFYEVGSAGEGFALRERPPINPAYEFTTFRLAEVRRLLPPSTIRGSLTQFPVYSSVLTTLHAQAWGDMSFFSVPGRHGDESDPYPLKAIPRRVSMTVLELGLIANLLAVVGGGLLLTRWRGRALLIYSAIGLAASVWWFLPQTTWALKTKYVLFLLPVYVACLVTALEWLVRRAPPVALGALAVCAALIIVTHLYLGLFAVGGW